MDTQPYDFQVAKGESAATVSFSGEIDYAASLAIGPELAMIADRAETDILFDLENVTLIDSEGIKMLLCAVESARSRRRQARIVRCSRHVDRVLRLAGVREALAGELKQVARNLRTRLPWHS